MNLVRKYRPGTLSDYFRQDVITSKTVVFESEEGNMPSTVLVVGEQGNGKSTISYILAKYYLCRHKGKHFDVCNICDSCKIFNKALATGDLTDIPNFTELSPIEVNFTGVLSDVSNDLSTETTFSDRKVYLIDDADMLNVKEQEALVTAIKGMSNNRLFIVCVNNTSNLSKDLLYTFSMAIKVDKLTEDKLFKHLAHICLEEDKNFTVDGLTLLASNSDMSVRETVNTLELILSTYESVTTEVVKEVLAKKE